MDRVAGDVAAALDRLSASIGEDWTNAELVELGHAAVTLVLLRTKQGLDVDRKPFAPYSASYIKQRQKAGLKTTPVDLARTGHMLGAITPRVSGKNEVTVDFSSGNDAIKAAAHNYGTSKTPQREFLDVRDKQEQDALSEMVGRQLSIRTAKVIK